MKVYAPFNPEQVTHLNNWQQNSNVHPFTCACGNTLEAREFGWYCPSCKKHVQDWCHDFMCDEFKGTDWASIPKVTTKYGGEHAEGYEAVEKALLDCASDAELNVYDYMDEQPLTSFVVFLVNKLNENGFEIVRQL
jgi:hypothetical protein